MMLRAVLRTTDTTHHRYYARKLNDDFPLHAILVEKRCPSPAFETFHRFEAQRDEYERDTLLAGWRGGFSEIVETREVESINEPDAVSTLQSLAPDVIVVFGTGKLLAPAIQIPGVACLNLHGGNPEQYRGLDTHLWAIYHGDFDGIVTTLHHVDADLDNGDIVFQGQLKLTRDSQLYQLRSVNTEICVDLSVLALSALERVGRVPSRRQLRRGRYYSFMPATLKDECLRKFNRYVARL